MSILESFTYPYQQKVRSQQLSCPRRKVVRDGDIEGLLGRSRPLGLGIKRSRVENHADVVACVGALPIRAGGHADDERDFSEFKAICLYVGEANSVSFERGFFS